MIGDRKFDIIGALENQLTAFSVLWGYGTTKELQQAKATSLLESPNQLYSAITKSSFPGKFS